ncbi:hypothetical protein FIU83_10050 [Halomonas sp. THAF5a]|nr:hypothetical protein FIU83_10050 [Halomonas sp. THAF5a]
MKTRLTLAALFVALLPLGAQANDAAERALHLNETPLAPVHHTSLSATPLAEPLEAGGDSTAMQKARARLQSQGVETQYATSTDRLEPARSATS